MLTSTRNKFAQFSVWVIISLITLVFIFYGVFNPSRTAGLHEGAVAGMVNGVAITRQEFARELKQKVDFFKQMGGGQISEEQMKMFRIPEGVFNEIVKRRLLLQAAVDQGFGASDEELSRAIRTTPVFQKEGKFDRELYERLLVANGLTLVGYETLERDRITLQNYLESIRTKIVVSDGEIRTEFETSKECRNIKFVLLTTEAGKKDVEVSANDVQKYLADSGQLNIAKGQFESKKDSTYKGKTFDQVKTNIARDLLAASKTEEVRKANEKISEKVLPLLKAEKTGDAALNKLLKPYGVEVKYSGLLTRQNPYLPGAGEAKETIRDAFTDILKRPKIYRSNAWVMVALVSESEHPDAAKYAVDRETIRNQLIQSKERELLDDVHRRLLSKAKIERNAQIVGDEAVDSGDGA